MLAEFEGEDELAAKRVTRILTADLPQYFAIVTRVRVENQSIGEEGGVISSKVVPQVQAVFPQGALNKKIKVGLQVGIPCIAGCIRIGAQGPVVQN